MMARVLPQHAAFLLFQPGGIVLPVWAVVLAIAAVVGCVAYAVVLTLQRRAVKERLAGVESSSHLKSDFLANMSHEIRTPMNGILGLTELALGTELNTIQREFLTGINESAASLLGIINEILDFSRIEAGKLELDRAEFDLHRLITEAVRSFAFQASEKNLELLYQVAPDVPRCVEGDATRLRQVIVNLLGNAQKFTRKGEVELRCDVTHAGVEQVHLRFSVRDTGIGIPKSKQKEIFAAFTQADSSINREYGGTGLGLTISSQLAKLMGGEIRVESKPGSGSTFHFYAHLGLVPVSEELSTAALECRKVLGGKRFLVIDDNQTNARNLEETLGSANARVTKANSADAARHALESAGRNSDAYDAVIIDSDMPDTDGFALADDVLRRSSGTKPAVMMLTSKNLNEHVERCRALGITFLLKPVSAERLMQVVADLVAARKPPAEVKPIAQKPKPTVPALQILLAEDNVVNQKIVLEMLKKANCQVQVVSNGAEAIASWKHQNYDLILMDMQMPRMDGTEAAAKIRDAEKSGRTRIPILALTANARDEDRQRCLAAGMDDYLSKPFKAEQLLEKVHQLAGGEKVPA